MSRFVGTSLLLLALIGKRCHLSVSLLPDLFVSKVLAVVKMNISSTIVALKFSGRWKLKSRI